MDRIRAHMLRQSLAYFRPCGPALVARAVRTIGDANADLAALMPEGTSRLNARWFGTLEQVVESCERFHRLERPLALLGAKAAAAGIVPSHYALIRDHLLAAMADLAGEDWTDELARSWRLLLEAASGAMLAGASSDRRAA